MSAGASVHEAHVGVDRRAAQVEAHRQLAAGHLVLEQGDRAVLSDRPRRERAGMGGDEELGHDAQDADLGPPHVLRGQGPVDHPAGVRGQVGSLEPGTQLGHDAVVRHLPSARQVGGDGDQLVELDQHLRIENDLEGARVALDRAVDESDASAVVVHAVRPSRLRCSTASRTARSAKRGSPCRWCRCRSRPAIGVRLTGARASRWSADAKAGSQPAARSAASTAATRPIPAGISMRAIPAQGPAYGPGSPTRR